MGANKNVQDMVSDLDRAVRLLNPSSHVLKQGASVYTHTRKGYIHVSYNKNNKIKIN